jgi:hypothetical protein
VSLSLLGLGPDCGRAIKYVAALVVEPVEDAGVEEESTGNRGISQPSLSLFVLYLSPVFANYNQHEIARSQRLLKYAAEVAVQSNTIHVHKYRAFAEPRYEFIEQSSSLAG